MKKLLKSYQFQLISRIMLFISGLTGIILQLWKNGGANMLLYYTILSNILVTSFVGYLIILMIKKDSRYQTNNFLRAKTSVTMAILITFVIYHVMLRPLVFPEQFYRSENFLCHYIVPLWFFLEGILFDNPIQFSKFDPLKWTIIPLVYSIWAIFNGLVTKFSIPRAPDSPFPYPFLNISNIGWSGVLLSSSFILIFYIFGGYFLLILKVFLGKFFN